MPDVSEKAALVALMRRGRRPRNLYAELVEEAGSALAVLEGEHAGAQARLFPDGAPDGAQELETAVAEIAAWRAEGIELLTVLDADYPENLRAVHDRPPLVF